VPYLYRYKKRKGNYQKMPNAKFYQKYFLKPKEKRIFFFGKISLNQKLNVWKQMVKRFFLLSVNQIREQRKFRLGNIWQ
jgi:hypothetical protein